jgi:sugar diacid utilization regulator
MNIDFATVVAKLKSYQSQVHLNHLDQLPLYQCIHVTQKSPQPSTWDDETFDMEITFDANTIYITDCPRQLELLLNKQCPHIVYVNDIYIPIPTTFQGNIIQILNSTLSFIYNQIQLILKTTQRLTLNCEKLYNLLLDDAGLQEIIDAAYTMLNNPIALCDLSFVLIAAPKQLSKDAIVADYIDTYNTASDFNKFYNIYRDKGFFEKVSLQRGPMIVKDADVDDLTYLISHVNVQQKPAAFISVLEYNHHFDDYDVELLAVLSKVVALEMQKSGYTHHIKQSKNEYWMYHLLEEHPLPDLMEQSKSFLQVTGYANRFCIMAIEIEKHAKHNTMLPFIQKNITISFGHTITLLYNNHITVLLPIHHDQRFKEEIEEKLLHFLKQNALLCGISQPFEQIKELKHHYLQAAKSIELAIQLHEEEKRLFLYENYVLYDLLNIYSSPTQLKHFCHPGLIKLMHYDNTYKTIFMLTLYQYLTHNCNQSKTASMLHIQRSTLLYRLKKIEDIMGVLLEEAEALLQLNMSFKILKFIGEFQD